MEMLFSGSLSFFTGISASKIEGSDSLGDEVSERFSLTFPEISA